jgi:cytosine/creatinine deaminase
LKPIARDGLESPFGAQRADLILRRCRTTLSDLLIDIGIVGDRIAALGTDLRLGGEEEVDVDGRVVCPAFVEPHIHLDKVGVAPLLGPNRSGTLAEAIQLLHQTKRKSTVDDVAGRAGQVIKQAVLAGTTVIRTHVDVDTIGGLTPLRGVLQAAHEHRDVCEVQVVAFPQEGIVRDPGTDELMRVAMRSGAGVVGGMPHWETTVDDARRHIDFCMRLAQMHDADVDMHVDETDDPQSRTFEMLLDATARYGWQGRVTAGHCCAMAAWDYGYRRAVIARAARIGVNVIVNPATNLLLQGRADREPRRRGIAPVKELLEAGVRVATGQDCVQDAFYPFGMADPLQVALILCHAAQLSTTSEVAAALAMIGPEAAAVLNLREYGIAVGCVADLVVLDAADASEALRLQADRRYVIRRGRLVVETTTKQTLYRSSMVAAAGTQSHHCA